MGRPYKKTIPCKKCGIVFDTNLSGRLTCPPCVNAKVRERARKYINRIKRNNPCSVCGESDSIVLQFHHIDPRTKWRSTSYAGTPWQKTGIAGLVGQGASLKSIRRELDKCIIVCANCHLKIEAGKIILVDCKPISYKLKVKIRSICAEKAGM